MTMMVINNINCREKKLVCWITVKAFLIKILWTHRLVISMKPITGVNCHVIQSVSANAGNWEKRQVNHFFLSSFYFLSLGTPFQWDDSEYAGFILKKSETIKPWLPIHPNYRDINVKNQEKAKRSTLKFYKDLLEIRKHDTFAYGSFNSTVINGNVFAYAR